MRVNSCLNHLRLLLFFFFCVCLTSNAVLPLELGFVAVVNRGQRDIQNQVGVAAALSSEKAFFEQHEVYGAREHAQLAASSLGTPRLVARLSRALHACIARVLPALKTKVQDLLRDTMDERRALGTAVPERDLKRCCLDQVIKDTHAVSALNLTPPPLIILFFDCFFRVSVHVVPTLFETNLRTFLNVIIDEYITHDETTHQMLISSASSACDSATASRAL